MKYLSILRYVLVIIGVIVTVVGVTGITSEGAGVDIMLRWSYVLLGITVAVALLMPLIGIAQNPKAALRSLTGVAIVAVVLIVAYAFSSAEPIAMAGGEVYDNVAGLKFTDTGLYTTYIALGGAIVAAILGEVINAFK